MSFCKVGHELTPENTNATGSCKECIREKAKARYRRQMSKELPTAEGMREKIASLVEPDGECEVWVGRVREGTPLLQINGRGKHPLTWLSTVDPDVDDCRSGYGWLSFCGTRFCVNLDHNEVVPSARIRETYAREAARAALPQVDYESLHYSDQIAYESGPLRTVERRVELGLFEPLDKDGNERLCEVCHSSDEWFFSPDILQTCRHCLASAGAAARRIGRKRYSQDYRQ